MHETEILSFETRVGCYARGLLSKGWEARANLAKDRDGIVIGSFSGKVPIRPNWDVTRGEKLTGECKGRQQQTASSHRVREVNDRMMLFVIKAKNSYEVESFNRWNMGKREGGRRWLKHDKHRR